MRGRASDERRYAIPEMPECRLRRQDRTHIGIRTANQFARSPPPSLPTSPRLASPRLASRVSTVVAVTAATSRKIETDDCETELPRSPLDHLDRDDGD